MSVVQSLHRVFLLTVGDLTSLLQVSGRGRQQMSNSVLKTTSTGTNAEAKMFDTDV